MSLNKSIVILTPGRSGSEYLADILSRITGYTKISKESSSTYYHEDFKDNCIYKRHYRFSYFVNMDVPIIVSMRDPRDIAVSAAYYNNEDVNHYLQGWKIDWLTDYIENKHKKKHYLFKIENFSARELEKCLQELEIKHEANIKEIIEMNPWKKYHEEDNMHYRCGERNQWKGLYTTKVYDPILKELKYMGL